MDIETFRTFCLSLPGSSEKMPFARFSPGAASILVFYVGGKMFCLCDIDRFDACVVKGRAEEVAARHENYAAVEVPRNLSPKYWVSVRFGADVSDALLCEWIRASHALVAVGKPVRGKKKPPAASDSPTSGTTEGL